VKGEGNLKEVLLKLLREVRTWKPRWRHEVDKTLGESSLNRMIRILEGGKVQIVDERIEVVDDIEDSGEDTGEDNHHLRENGR
jgi:hypothetical protein